MREHIYKAKRLDDGEWIFGYYWSNDVGNHFIKTTRGNGGYWILEEYEIDSSTLSRYTGCEEFTITNGYSEQLFENDIVEIWVERSVYGCVQSQYDGWVKARGKIKFKNGSFYIDLNNKYNNSIFKAKGLEEYDRDFRKTKHLIEFHWIDPERLQWQQEHNPHYKFNDIVRIGNIFDNPELLNKGA